MCPVDSRGANFGSTTGRWGPLRRAKTATFDHSTEQKRLRGDPKKPKMKFFWKKLQKDLEESEKAPIFAPAKRKEYGSNEPPEDSEKFFERVKL